MPWISLDDLEHVPEYEAKPDYHSVMTIQLVELLNSGFIEVSDDGTTFSDSWDWEAAAGDEERYKRLCAYFLARFKYRELASDPWEFKNFLLFKLQYEIMPKFRPIYDSYGTDGLDFMQVGGEYGKDRDITSDYPETLLSDNADYISTGHDKEFEHIRTGDVLERLKAVREGEFASIDELVIDELECLFTPLIQVHANAL